MSHLRNLLHKPAAREQNPMAGSATTVTENLGNHSRAATAELPVLPEFATEVAQIEPEARLAYYSNPRGQAADRYRLLRMRLKEHWRAGNLKKLLVTGALAHDGKSTVTLNLATALAERGKHKVLVIEADLHHSCLGENLRLRPWAGLTECLADSLPPLSAIRRVEPLGWFLLPAGEPRKNPTELLQAPGFGQLVQKLAPSFDWVLIDSPPVVPLTDSLSLQQHADACLLVVRAGQTPREAVEQSIELLGRNNLVGVVLNGIETLNRPYYQYGYNYGGDDE